MAANERSSDARLALLRHQGEELNFFQAMRLLEPSLSERSKVRFKVVNTDAFRPNFIAGVRVQNNLDKTRTTTVSVNGFGLTGMQGPVPQCFSELLRRAEVKGAQGREQPEGFLDIFHDRLISLLYEIKKHFNPMLFNEQPHEHALYTLFSSISGVSLLNLFDRLPVEKHELASFAPIMANRRVDYSHIVSMIKQYFDCRVKIVPNRGAWRVLPKELRAKVSADKTKLSSQQTLGLGKGIGLGKKFWDIQAALYLDIYVPDIDTCHQLLPNGEKHQELRALLSFLSDGKYLFHVRLKLDWQAAPQSKLQPSSRLKLSQTAWLKTTDRKIEQQPPDFLVYPSLKHDFAEQNASAESIGEAA